MTGTRDFARARLVGAAVTATALLSACAAEDPPRQASSSSPPRAAGASPADRPAPAGAVPAPAGEETATRLVLSVGGQRFTATLDDSAAARDLLAQLPLTVAMTDHGGVERTGPLPAPLSLEGQPDVGDPDVGDLGYYAPGDDLVLYYGDQGPYPGIVVLGRLDGDAAERLPTVDGPVTATVEALDA